MGGPEPDRRAVEINRRAQEPDGSPDVDIPTTLDSGQECSVTICKRALVLDERAWYSCWIGPVHWAGSRSEHHINGVCNRMTIHKEVHTIFETKTWGPYWEGPLLGTIFGASKAPGDRSSVSPVEVRVREAQVR